MLSNSSFAAPQNTAKTHSRHRNRKKMKGLHLSDILRDLSREVESLRQDCRSLHSLEVGQSAATSSHWQ